MYSVFLISTPAQTPLALRPNGCTLIRKESREVFFLWSGILGGRGAGGGSLYQYSIAVNFPKEGLPMEA
jgi:hypothetical protein